MAQAAAIESKFGGKHGNLWNEAQVAAGGLSAPVDISMTLYQQVFGSASAATNIDILVSQDGEHWYVHQTIALEDAADFSASLQLAARWLRLRSSAAATITATCARKGRAQ